MRELWKLTRHWMRMMRAAIRRDQAAFAKATRDFDEAYDRAYDEAVRRRAAR